MLYTTAINTSNTIRTGDADRLPVAAAAGYDAGSATLSAYVGSWTRTRVYSQTPVKTRVSVHGRPHIGANWVS